MTALRTQDVRRNSIRVAIAATAVVAAAYLVVAVAVAAIFTSNQTSQIDSRLATSLAHPHFPVGGPGDDGFGPPDPDRPGGLPVLAWVVLEDGSVRKDYSNAFDLPGAYKNVASPTTVTIDGQELRISGAPVSYQLGNQAGTGYLVVGQSLEPLYQARGTVVLAEVLIAPVLLAIVFLGAVAIGRRVASPIEAARRRQLEFTADASHELRTPLSVVEAQTSLALAQQRSADWYREAFTRIDPETKRMRKLLDDLLWLARFDATQGSPHAEPVDLAVLAAATADRFGVVAESRRLGLEVQAPTESMVVTAPPEWLDRLLGVLLDNACKYSPQGGTVVVAVGSDGGRIALTVDDSGPGIPEEERPRIFDRFHRANDTGGGAGLGLAIADAIVRATGARWKIGSSPTGGARMSVSWPRAFSGPRESAATAPSSSPTV